MEAFRQLLGSCYRVRDHGIRICAYRKEIYEMETAKVVLERTLEKVNKKLNAMYDAHAKEGK